jgi:hypothetical protein
MISLNQCVAQNYNHVPYFDHSDPLVNLNFLQQSGYPLDTTNIAALRALVDTAITPYSTAAGFFLADRGHSEAIPNLKARYSASLFTDHDAFLYLASLYLLRDPDVPQMLRTYVDTMLAFRPIPNASWNGPYDQRHVYDALTLLSYFGDYSHYAALNSIVDQNASAPMDLFEFYNEHVPSLHSTIFQKLEGLLTIPELLVQKEVIASIGSYFNDIPDAVTLLHNLALNDSSIEIRLYAVSYFKDKEHDPVIVEACEQIAKVTTDLNVFEEAVSDIAELESPYSSVSLINIANARRNESDFYNYVSNRLYANIPLAMTDTTSILNSIDTLASHLQQTSSLGWIGNLSFVNDLSSILQSGRSFLVNKDSLNCAAKLSTFESKVDQEYKDSVDRVSSFVSNDGWNYLYFESKYILDHLPKTAASGLNVILLNSGGAKLTGGTLQYYDGSWKPAVNNNDGTFTIKTTFMTVSLQMTYAYGVQTKSNVAVGTSTIVFQTVNAQVKLQNSQGNLIDTGTVQYYAGAWRNFGTTTSGVATMELLPINYSFSMTYAFASNNKAQDLSANPIVVFQTTNTSVQLKNSQGNLMDTGTVQYYSGAWRTFGTTTNGVTTKELLPNSYSFSMTYANASNNKQQDISANSTVVFQTVNAAVQLKNSQGNLIDQGTVQYYSGAWRTFGTTSGGVTTKELLPNSYSFSMTFAYATNNKQQDIGANSTVVFQTVNAAVQLKNSQGSLIDQGTVQYYSGAWRTFGTTSGGVITKELLPNSYSFSMTYAYASNNKQQDIGANSTVVFQTVNAAVQLKNSQGSLIDQGTVQYYSGAWRTFGTTSGGVTTKELLPNSYSFSMTYAFASNNKQQDLNSNTTVVFQTVNTTIQLKNSQGNLMDTGTIQYYSGAWRAFGTTTNGGVSMELLPNSYQFNMTYAYVTNSKTQDVGSNNTVTFSTVLATVNVINTQNNPVNNAAVTYYSGAWRQFGNTVNGNATKELLPASLQFRAQSGSASQNKTQDLSANPLVAITLNVGQ